MQIQDSIFRIEKEQVVDGYIWYVINCYAGKEFQIKEYIEKKLQFDGCEYKIKIPQKKMLERKRGEYRETLKVIFSGYIFVLANAEQNVEGLLDEIEILRFKNIGIIKILKELVTNRHLAIKKNEIMFIEKLMNKDDIVDYTFGFKIGESVHIISGPFKDQISQIVKINYRKFRISVKLSFLGEQTVDFPFNYIEACK